MPGRGPAPKTDDRRARRNKDAPAMNQVEVYAATQPTLQALFGDYNPISGEEWTHATLVLWKQLGEFPTTKILQGAQWSSLARAMMHDDAMIRGVKSSAAEARIRMAKFGIDPDDLLRLRIQLVSASEAEAEHNENQKRRSSNVNRYAGLQAVDTTPQVEAAS